MFWRKEKPYSYFNWNWITFVHYFKELTSTKYLLLLVPPSWLTPSDRSQGGMGEPPRIKPLCQVMLSTWIEGRWQSHLCGYPPNALWHCRPRAGMAATCLSQRCCRARVSCSTVILPVPISRPLPGAEADSSVGQGQGGGSQAGPPQPGSREQTLRTQPGEVGRQGEADQAWVRFQAPVHASLGHRPSLMKHKFKDNLIKNGEIILKTIFLNNSQND